MTWMTEAQAVNCHPSGLVFAVLQMAWNAESKKLGVFTERAIMTQGLVRLSLTCCGKRAGLLPCSYIPHSFDSKSKEKLTHFIQVHIWTDEC